MCDRQTTVQNPRESPPECCYQESSNGGIDEGIDGKEVDEDDGIDNGIGDEYDDLSIDGLETPSQASSNGDIDADDDSDVHSHESNSKESNGELNFQADESWEIERLRALSCTSIHTSSR